MRILMSIFLFSLVGCATSYTCQDYPTGKCQTVSKVYKRSKHPLKGKKEVKVKQSNKGNKVIVNKLEGNPLLLKPKVIRIYINHWEDKEGDLHVGGYIFVKVKGAEWNI
jgi:hypothetical protein